MTLKLMLTAGMLASTVGAANLISHFDFEEKCGAFADDLIGTGNYAALHPEVKWVEGGFGGAIATGAKGAGVKIGKIPGLDGADAGTVFLRFRRESEGWGAHQCLLSADRWGDYGGVQMQFSGKTLLARLRASGNGPECSFKAFKDASNGKWHSVAIVFKRPQIKVYADGKLAAQGAWNHPLRDGGSHIGSWMSHSFGGFIDDVRFYGEALSEREIAELAEDSRYAELEGYQDDGTGGIAKTRIVEQGGNAIATFKNSKGEIIIDSAGFASSIRDVVSARNLSSNRISFVEADVEGIGKIVPRSAEMRSGDKLAFIFPGGMGEIEFETSAFDGGWKFVLAKCTLKNLKALEFCRLRPDVISKWKGSYVNAWSDEKSAIAVRSGDIKANTDWNRYLCVRVDGQFPAVGRSAFLAIGPRESFREQLKAMTIAAGVPRSDSGGAWSMDSEVARWSYVFAPIENGDVDYWIEFVKRAGFSLIHINSNWTPILGEYQVSKRMFPGGLDEMAAACDKIHAAGLKCGIHTLTACIQLNSSWIQPVCDSNLVFDATYTLAEEFGPESTEMVVLEKPIDRHSTVYTYSSNGNFLWYNGEVMQYSGIRREKPYGFTGLKRGVLKTRKVGTIPAGAKVGYLHQRYCAFYPSPDGPLADKVAEQLGKVYNTCKLDEFYFDGSEGMGTRYGIDAMRHKIFSRLKAHNGHSPSIEASCGGANNWWFQTRTATTDHGVYGVKRFHDWHIDWAVRQGRLCNFLEPQMGWWQPRLDCPHARGHFPDEMEYFAGKNAGHDAAMSIQGVGFRPLASGIRRQLSILGWYEYPRLARAFAPAVKEYLAGNGTEGRLRQNAKGEWKFTKIVSTAHRARNEWERKWKVGGASMQAEAALRVEALYGAKPEKEGVTLLSCADFAELSGSSAEGVATKLDRDIPGYNGSRAFRLAAENTGAKRNASWARAKFEFAFPGKDVGKNRLAFGAWVKGDGSGALLNLQVSSPGAFVGGVSDHYVRLDFTGWKYISFFLRERDSAKFSLYSWPYGGGYASIYRSRVSTEHIGTFAAYLNDIPQGSSASVEIGEVKALESIPVQIKNAAVAISGVKYAVPYVLESGEYAELDGGRWTKFSARGDALESCAAQGMPKLSPGENEVEFSADAGCAEVTVVRFGETVDALVKKLTPQMRSQMRYEAMMPFEWNPGKGLYAPATIPVRRGGKAKWSFEIAGPCENPTFAFKTLFGMKDNVYRIEAVAAADEAIICRNGIDWKVVKTRNGATVREGRLAKPLPLLRASYPLTFSATVPEDKACVVDILKEYIELK